LADDEDIETLSSRLSRVLLTETTLDIVLSLVTSFAREAITGAESVSVTLAQDGRMLTPASSDPIAVDIDQVQYDRGAGPCLDAARTGSEVSVPDLGRDVRWPHVQAKAQKVGIGSVLSVPLSVNETPLGALNVYSRSTEGLGPAGLEEARRFAEQATVLLANAQAFARSEERNEQLREALASRDVIGQAKGILMEREGVTADQAFDILRRASQRSNIKLRELAEQLTRQRDRQRSSRSSVASSRSEEGGRSP
jgi:GAF domain-containing protein